MTRHDDPRPIPLQAARTAAGRFRAVATGRPVADRQDALRRVRAAQRRLEPPETRFAHLRAAHD